MLHYFDSGGIFMWPIFFLFVLSLGVMFEKIYYFTFYELDANTEFKMTLAGYLNNSNYEQAIEFCKNYKNTIAKTAIFALKSIDFQNDTRSQVDYVLEEAINSSLANLEKRNWILSMCASVAPQLGLLGTIVGMIRSFGGLGNIQNAPEVALGISEALYTTATGLIVAIPCIIFHVIINKKIDSIVLELNRIVGLLSRRFCEVCS